MPTTFKFTSKSGSVVFTMGSGVGGLAQIDENTRTSGAADGSLLASVANEIVFRSPPFNLDANGTGDPGGGGSTLLGRSQIRRQTAAVLSSTNPMILPGELVIETNTRLMKANTGGAAAAYNSLAYLFVNPSSPSGDLQALADVLSSYLIPWTPATPSGLIADYKCNEAGGTTFIDRSGNGYNGTVATGGVFNSYGFVAGGSTGGVDTSIPWSSVKTVIALVTPGAGGVDPGTLFDSIGVLGTSLKFNGQISAGQLAPRARDNVSGNSTSADCSVNSWPVVVMFTDLDTATPKIYLDGNEPVIYDVQQPVNRVGNVGIGRNYAGQSGGQTFHEILFYSTALSTENRTKAVMYLRGLITQRAIPTNGPAVFTTPLLALVGNSLVAGQQSGSMPSFQTSLVPLLKRSADVITSAINGGSPAAVVAKAVQAVFPLRRPLAPSLVLLWPTPNAGTVEEVMNSANAFGSAARLLGWLTILQTAISANNGFDTIMVPLNLLYADPVNGWRLNFDALSDLTGFPELSAVGAHLNTTNFPDNLHPSDNMKLTRIIPTEATAFASLLPPVASFTPSAALVAPGGSVTFTDASVGVITSRAWNFGDGGTSTATNPTHTFAAAGAYTVSLTVTGPKGTHTTTTTINVSIDAAILTLNPELWNAPSLTTAINTAGAAPSIGDRISQLFDLSTYGRGGTQATAGTQMLFGKDVGDAFYHVQADKTRVDFVQYPTNAFSGLTGGGVLFLVLKATDGGFSGLMNYGSAAAAGNNWFNFSGVINSSFASTTRYDTTIPGGVTVTNWNVYMFKSIPNEYTVKINGVTVSTVTGPGTNVVGWASVPILGKNNIGGGSNLKYAAQLIFPGSLGSTGEADVLAYLRTKYGTP